jgi:hypothetical protein
MNYDNYEHELLAIHEALRKWRHYLEGIKFWVEADHQSLKWLDDVRILNRRPASWIMNIHSFDFTIGYSPGDLNTVAGILSGRPNDFSHCERCRTFLEINSVDSVLLARCLKLFEMLQLSFKRRSGTMR